MERIKQALEKARRRGTEQGPGQASTAVADTAVPGGSTAPPTVDVLDVSYRQTRVVELDPNHLERHRIVAFNKHLIHSWVFDLLRTQVLRKMDENGWRTLAITSPTPEAGKTVVAINLAMSIAYQTDKTAMLVDFDLRRPKIASYLGLPAGKSFNEVLDGSAEISEVLVNPGLPRLVLLPTQRPVQHSSEVLSSRKVANLIEEIRARYESRIVIFDLPPVLSADDTIAFLPQIDCVLMVVGNGMSTKSEIEDSLLHLSSANLLGVALNKEESERSNYNYYYQTPP